MDIEYKVHIQTQKGKLHSQWVKGFAYKTKSIGLAIHKIKYNKWGITHIMSGKLVWVVCGNNKRAKEILKTLDGITDWTLSETKLKQQEEEIYKKIKLRLPS